MMGCPVSGLVPSTQRIDPADDGVDGDHGLRLLAGQVDAFFGRHLELFLAVLVDVQQCEL